MAQEEKAQKTPPYMSFRIMSNFIDWMREVGVPTLIDRSFWGQRLSGSSGTYLVSALRFLDLLDPEDRPTNALEEIVADKEKGKALLRERLLAAYRPALQGLTLERASFGELQTSFEKEFGLKADTLRKAVTFFVHGAEHAQIPLSKFITDKARTVRTSEPRKPPRRAKQARTAEDADDAADVPAPNGSPSQSVKSPAEMLLDLLDPESMDENEQMAVWTLIKYIKKG